MTAYKTDITFARHLDQADPLADQRKKFYIPRNENGKEAVYFLGNSLGLQPKTAESAVLAVLEEWKKRGIDGYFQGETPWLTYNEALAAPYAAILGAKPVEIVAMNTLSVNLHLMMVSFYRPQPGRFKIMIEQGAFPSDIYAVKSQIAFHGFDPDEGLIELAPREGEKTLRYDDILQRIDAEGENVALILLGGVNYYTGQLFDMADITRAGHEKGCKVGFDLAHAAGNVPLSLHDWDVDFACWCSYKYLNGGPAGIAGSFVHERYSHDFDLPRFTGWWGNAPDSRFQMKPDFQPSPGAAGWQLSNAPILSLAPVKASLDIFSEVGMDALREKSLQLTGYLEFMLDSLNNDSFEIITPRDPAQRGCQLSLVMREGGKDMHDKLVKAGIVCDWREPDSIRLAPVPLYNSYGDVYDFVQLFAASLA